VLDTGKSSRGTATSGEEASARRRKRAAEKTSPPSRSPEESSPGKEFSEKGFSETERGLSKRETGLLRKLTNAGVWPREAGKLVRRYSTGRVEANFQLWRRRKNDPEAPSVKSDGAFLRAAIAEGYAAFTEGTPCAGKPICAEDNASAKDNGSGRETTSARKAAPARKSAPAKKATSAKKSAPAKKAARKQRISHKQKVSPREKRRLTREEEIDPAHFHRYRQAQSPEEKQFLYLDPAAGSPEPRGDVPAT
jgi:hypothetical protein